MLGIARARRDDSSGASDSGGGNDHDRVAVESLHAVDAVVGGGGAC